MQVQCSSPIAGALVYTAALVSDRLKLSKGSINHSAGTDHGNSPAVDLINSPWIEVLF